MIKGFFVSLCFYDFFAKTGLVKNMDLGFLFHRMGRNDSYSKLKMKMTILQSKSDQKISKLHLFSCP